MNYSTIPFMVKLVRFLAVLHPCLTVGLTPKQLTAIMPAKA